MPERNTIMQDGAIVRVPMAAAKIEAGNLVAMNASGYAAHAADTASFKVMGRAEETVDNTGGAAGDKSVTVRRLAAFWWKNDATNAVAVTDIGGNCFVKDSTTVQNASATNDIVVGKVLEIDAARGVLVYTA